MLALLDVDKLLTFTIIGLSTGAIYAIIAAGLVVTYTTSGIFNLAHGATGMLAAFTYWQFRFAWGWPAPVALVVVLLMLCPLFGAATERFIMRGLKGTTEVIRLTVTVALFAGMLGLANWIWPPDGSRVAFRRFFEGNTVPLGGINVSWHRVITLACAVLVAAALRYIMFRSRAGVTMRAVVDDRDLAELNGGRPDRVAMLAWALGAGLAGLAGVLLAGEQQLNIEPLVLLVINAYAAAILGRLRSLPWTFAGAALLGLLDSYYLGYLDGRIIPSTMFGFSLNGLRASIPIIVLFIALVAMPVSRLRVGAVRFREKHREPVWSTSLLGAVLLVTFVIAISGMLTRANTLLAINGFVFAIAALSLVPLTGYAGQLSLAPMTFAGLGAIAMAKLPGNGSILTLAGAILIVAGIGAIVALPALRLSGVYLALATAAFAVLVSKLVFNQRQTFQTGNIDVPTLAIPFVDIGSPRSRLILLSVAFAVLGLCIVALRRSPLGRRLIALKDSQAAAATLGMNLTATKVAAFAISAGIAACAGALVGDKVSPQQYDFLQSLPVVLLAVVGGVASVAGALLGGMLLGGSLVLVILAPAMTNISKVLPGAIGITLGRNPSGASEQIAENFRALAGRWGLISVAVAGGTGVWFLANRGIISNWSFVFAIAVWTLGVVPNLPALAERFDRRTVSAGIWLAAGMAAAAFIDWGTAVGSSGWRLLVLIAVVFTIGPIGERLLDRSPRVRPGSPDAIGLTDDLTPLEVEDAERRIGVVL
ncbi:MAG: ABC transporter permease [Ilumatobacter sp.]|nr:MAG: ABC transporter permease [Ilumatobacter sp.]